MRLLHTLALLAITATVSAQVQLSPIPQKADWGSIAISGNTYYTVIGAKTADKDAVRALDTLLEGKTAKTAGAQPVRIVIGERGDGAVSAWKSKIPTRPEGYYLSIKKGQIVVAGADGNGTFYAVQTLRQILAADTIQAVEITDWPDVAERGVVEGFYGNPWSHADRLHQFHFYGQNKMNTYIYGPKDDPYHRDHWRTPYPADMGKKITELVDAAHANKVKFVWAVHPGIDIKWIKEDSINIVNKLESVYKMGVRSFAVFFDDISGEGTRAEKQAGLLNYITDEFVRKHHDVEPLIMCPTQYNKSWSHGDYLSVLGSQTYPEVRIMWTGARVIDMINEEDVDWIKAQIGRNSYIWLNWPVNDYCVGHMLMGATYGNDLTISDRLAGYVSNPMEYAEASLLSLYSIADYCWHMATYDHQTSWRNAMHVLLPGHEEAFAVFCDHNTDLGANGHGMRRMEESAALAKAVESGDDQAAIREFNRMHEAALELMAIKDNPLVEEMRPWLEVMDRVATRGALACNLRYCIAGGNKLAATSQFKVLMGIDNEQQKIVSRDFPGSIKSPNPQVATLVGEPYIKKTIRECEAAYRTKWGNNEGLFPEPVIEDGQYYIVMDGKRLTNKNANPNNVGDYPTFEAYNDSINPMRQQWNIRMDAETGRYSIINAQDGRYLNENGAFRYGARNPYEAAWHTYILTKHGDKFSIQNDGLAGRNYWAIEGNRIKQDRNEKPVFQLIPVQ